MTLNFKEIPQANGSDGSQDTFELFARDFLQMMGYRIIEDPARGADGKKDLIVEEVLRGVAEEQTIRWLVSCKHYVHSGRSVSDSDEINIRERLEQHKCDGFMGFYSTLPSTGLQNMIKALPHWIVFDHEKIESHLLKRNPEALLIAARYFPESFKNYQIENPLPAELYDQLLPLTCDCCGDNILEKKGLGIFAMYKLDPCYDANGVAQVHDEQVKRVYFACKGNCENALKRQSLDMGLFDCMWGEASDLCVPSVWITNIMGFINGIYTGSLQLDEESFKKMKQLYLATFQYVARNLTTKEGERVASLKRFGLI